MTDIYDQLQIPEENRKTSINREQGEYIFEFLRARSPVRTLETGFAYGCSTAYILSATSGLHIAIDPYQESYKNLGLLNVTRLGLQHRLEFIKLPSHVALPHCLSRGTAIDFAFIDGGHLFDEIFIDWFYIDRLLNMNGYVMFDDSWLQSTQAVASFIRNNRKDYREVTVPVANTYLFEKVGKDQREWSHFTHFSANVKASA
jgi:predicted O-methyltransferase YrrM